MKGAITLGILAALAGVSLAATSGILISRAALRPEYFLSLILLVTAVRALGVGRAAFRYAERLSGHAAALRLGEHVRLKLFDTISSFGRDLLAFERSGDLLSRAATDTDARQMYMLRATLPLLAFVGVTLLMLVGLFFLDPLLAFLAVLPLTLAALGVLSLRPKAAALARQRLILAREHTTRLLDTLGASADGAAKLALPELNALNDQLRLASQREAQLTAALTSLRESMFLVAVTAVLWRGAVLVAAGDLASSLLAGVVLASAAAFDAVAQLTPIPAAFTAWQEAEERDQVLQNTVPSVREPQQPKTLPTQAFEMEFKDVSLKRGGRTVLERVNWKIKTGQRVALLGPSGSGKTTLARLLMRDLDPTEGQVLLNGVPLPQLQLAELRALISMHEQDAPLLDGTIAENLLLGNPNASNQRLQSLLADLQLDHLTLDQWVGEGGSRLSGGERARICLARALLKPSELLILDEPTAHLDSDTEQQVLQVIDRELAGRALLLITHRTAPQQLASATFQLETARLDTAKLNTTQSKAGRSTQPHAHSLKRMVV